MWWNRGREAVSILLILTVLAISGCSPADKSTSSNLSLNCAVADDQHDSFMPRVSGYPISVLVDNDFTYDEKQALYRAVQEWNAFGQSQGLGDMFHVTTKAVTYQLRAADPHDCSSDSPLEGAPFLIMRERSNTHWRTIGFGPQVPGATIRCGKSSEISRQVIYVNPGYAQSGQLEKVFLHELGHSLGMDHSCLEGDGRSGFKGCAGLEVLHPYRVAVMYPWLQKTPNTVKTASSNQGREPLQSNDMVRAQCVTGPTAQ